MCRAFYDYFSYYYSQVFRTFFMSTYILFPLLLLLVLFSKTIISKTASKVFGNDGFLFPSFFVALLWKHNLIHFAGLIITFLSLLHLSSTKGQTSAAFHQLTKKKIFFSRLCQSPFLHPWPFFVFDHGRLTPLAFLLSFYHHLSTYYLREEKSTIITW